MNKNRNTEHKANIMTNEKHCSYPAHFSKTEYGTITEQSVGEHSENTAKISSDILNRIGLASVGELGGWLHDIGKCSEDFKSMMLKLEEDENARTGKVIHTFYGVKFVMDELCDKSDNMSILTSELIAAAVGGHHGQFDIYDSKGCDGIEHRLNSDIPYDKTFLNFCSECKTKEELSAMFSSAVHEVGLFTQRINASGYEDTHFYLGMLYRMILSSLIEGDRYDTADFMSGGEYSKNYPVSSCDWGMYLKRVEGKLDTMPKDGEINAARRKISDMCAQFGDMDSGLYRLSVPTGGGKTLSSLRAALAHAEKHKKSRIFYVIPLLSILDQNAKVIRANIEDDSIILEHHSNVISESKASDSENKTIETDKNKLLTENWDSPIVITTLVQFLNTLFDGRTSCIRRFHSLIDSVIVIDEVQTVPYKMLSLFNLAINFLTRFCGATVVLSSATQPEFSAKKFPMDNAKNMIQTDESLLSVFRRTKVYDLTQRGMDEEEIAYMAEEKSMEYGSALVICNKRAEAAKMYKAMSDFVGCRVYHLSNSLCTAHRRKLLDNIITDLKEGRRVLCFATQLVEAGVDFSFGCVIRLLAGVDNIVQSAGRCNRNGESDETSPVYVVRLKGERMEHLEDIKRSQNAAEVFLYRYEADPEMFDSDIISEKSIKFYYEHLFGNAKVGACEFTVRNLGTIFDMLSCNNGFCAKIKSESENNRFCAKVEPTHVMRQAFKTAGDYFEVFDDDTQDFVVPYGYGNELITELSSERCMYDLEYRRKIIKKCAEYTVSLRQYEVKKLSEMQAFYTVCEGGVAVLHEGYYDDSLGFVIDGTNDIEAMFL